MSEEISAAAITVSPSDNGNSLSHQATGPCSLLCWMARCSLLSPLQTQGGRARKSAFEYDGRGVFTGGQQYSVGLASTFSVIRL